MKKFYSYLSILFILIFAIYYFLNYGERIIKVNKKDLVGEYILKYKDFYYELILQEDNRLSLLKKYKHKIILKKYGKWSMKDINGNQNINVVISDFDSIKFSLGEVNKNLFTGQIKIEAFSMGEFLGKEDDASFLKI